MNDPNPTIRLLVMAVGLAAGILAAIIVTFMGLQSWSLRTTVYSAMLAALIVGGIAYTLTERYFKNRPPNDE